MGYPKGVQEDRRLRQHQRLCRKAYGEVGVGVEIDMEIKIEAKMEIKVKIKIEVEIERYFPPAATSN